MMSYQDFGSVLSLILGFAFLLIWQEQRQNRAAGYWGLAHIALALAAFAGYRFQESPVPWLGLLALICTSVFLVALYAGNRSLIGARIDTRDVALGIGLMVILVGSVGFGIDQLAGRLLVQSLMILMFAWSGWHFWSRLSMHDVGAAFLFRALALLATFTQGPRASTTQQDLWINVLQGLSMLVLALLLIKVAVRQSGQRIEQVLRHLPDAVVARRLDGTVLFCNQRFAQLAGVATPAQLVGRPVPLLAGEGIQADKIVNEINDVARSGPMREPMVIERAIRDAAGNAFTAEIIYSNYQEFGQTVVVVQARDISERKRAEAERVRLLATDPLTKLLNRQGLEVQFDTLRKSARPAHTAMALMVVDIHRFKRLNDALGQERGDAVLCSIGEALTQLEGATPWIGRTGGNEFTLVFSGLDEHSASHQLEQLAQHILRTIRREERSGDMAILLQANIGMAMATETQSSWSGLMQMAQVALQVAKAEGPAASKFYNTSMDVRLLETIRVESALREALAAGELCLHYQPIRDAQTGALVKVEALVRWQSASLGNVPPVVFIPVAEQSQLIVDIGRWIVNEACRQAAAWAAIIPTPPTVGINISVRQFAHPKFEEELLAATQRHGLAPAALDLELTESLFVDLHDHSIQHLLQRLTSAGFGLSLDDFGTGYSSLSYLARFPLTAVKVDRSFVRGMDTDERQRSIVRAIISMGHNLGLRVIAEGVETEAERHCLQIDGCDLLQGYLLGRPVSPQQLDLALRA